MLRAPGTGQKGLEGWDGTHLTAADRSGMVGDALAFALPSFPSFALPLASLASFNHNSAALSAALLTMSAAAAAAADTSGLCHPPPSCDHIQRGFSRVSIQVILKRVDILTSGLPTDACGFTPLSAAAAAAEPGRPALMLYCCAITHHALDAG